MKLGDAISTVATPIARALKMDCIDPETNQLRPESPCAKRKAVFNQFSEHPIEYVDAVLQRIRNRVNKP